MRTERLGQLVAAADALELDAFLRLCPVPVLLVPMAPEATRSITRAFVHAPGDPGDTPTFLAYDVLPVRKRAGAVPLRNMITLGRGQANDLELSSREVSKVHAYFTVDPQGTYTVTDAGSTNGTLVEGRPLTPHEEHAPLRGGEELSFGGLDAVFHVPATLWRYLRTLDLRAATP